MHMFWEYLLLCISLFLSLSLSLDIISIHECVIIHAKHTRTQTRTPTQRPSPFSATDRWKSDSDEKCREMTCSASFSQGFECIGICVLPRASAKANRLLVEPGFSPRSVNMRCLSSTEITLGNGIVCILPIFYVSSTGLVIVSILGVFCLSSIDNDAGIQSTSDHRCFGEAVDESSAVGQIDGDEREGEGYIYVYVHM